MRLAKRRFRDRSASKRRASSQDRDLEFKISSTADRACVVEPVVRANDHSRHDSCCAGSRARCGRGSPVTFDQSVSDARDEREFRFESSQQDRRGGVDEDRNSLLPAEKFDRFADELAS